MDPSRLPPFKDNLVPHIARVNHHLAHYKRTDKAISWSPNPCDPGQGWEKVDKGIVESVWSCGSILPPALIPLIDLLEKNAKEAEENKGEDELEIDYDELFDDD